MPLLEAIEQRAAAQGPAVDARVGQRSLLPRRASAAAGAGHFDRVIVSATDSPQIGLSGDDPTGCSNAFPPRS
jgi:hypothetical protein